MKGNVAVKLSIGVLIIGSLYWDSARQSWRDSRLRLNEAFVVRAPIRYGRRSETRGNTYTMVFSRLCELGQALLVRCLRDVSTADDLIAEAEHLWTAERSGKPNHRVSAGYGCVALLRHPHQDISQELLDAWAGRVSREQGYGNVPQTAREGCLVSDRGLLQIPWPTLIDGNNPVAIDLLLATANHPTLEGERKSYPTPVTIADAWRKDSDGNVSYFWNNNKHGIRTFEDEAIRERLKS
jgi:hypothetical protein